MQLSNRLKMAASLVREGYLLVDVGTDHGYVPVALMEQHKIPGAYALDINKGPLERAKEHIQEGGWEGKIIPILSDGLQNMPLSDIISPAALLIAGMGGNLVISILEKSWEKVQRFEQVILSPHSDVEKVRTFLYSHNMKIVQENMLEEEGKFYFFLVCERDGAAGLTKPQFSKELVRYGKHLLENKDAVLWKYLQLQHKNLQELQASMSKAANVSVRAGQRLWEVKEELEVNERAMAYYSQTE